MPAPARTTCTTSLKFRWDRAWLPLLFIGLAACATTERSPNPLPVAKRAELRINEVRVVDDIYYPEIAPLLRQAVERIVVPEFKGTKPVRLDIVMDHYQLASTGQIVIAGGLDVVAATASVVEVASGVTLAQYSVNVVLHSGGLVGVAVRGESNTASQRYAQGYALHLKREMQRP